jgi:hypothetical protein
MTTIIVPRWLARVLAGAAAVLVVLMAINTLVAVQADGRASGAIRSNRINQRADTQALCNLRADVQRRVDAGHRFLREHPDGIPGLIPAATLRANDANSQRTVDALSSLTCSDH